jgi:DNA-binding GntR family transcriptional regulator
VREALIRLQKEGLVEVIPRHGMRVLPVSPADMKEIYEILSALVDGSRAAGEAPALRRGSPARARLARHGKSARADDPRPGRGRRPFHRQLIGSPATACRPGGAQLWDRVHRVRSRCLRPKRSTHQGAHGARRRIRAGDRAAPAMNRAHRERASRGCSRSGRYRLQHL